MRRRAIVAFAIAASALVITATPAAAATSNTITDGSDLDLGTTSDEGTIVDEPRDQVIYTEDTVDSFEDQDLDGWTTSEGSSSSVSIVDSPAYDKDYAVKMSHSGLGAIARLNTTSYDAHLEPGGSLSVWIRANSTDVEPQFRFAIQDKDNHYQVRLDYAADEIRIVKKKGGSKTTVANQSVALSNTIDQYGQLLLDWDSSGSLTALYDGPNGEFANPSVSLTEWSSGAVELVIADLDSGTESILVDQFGHIGTPESQYVGPGTSIGGSSHAFINFTQLKNTEASVTWQGYDGSGWDDLRTDTYTSAGNYTVSLDPNYQNYRPQVNWSAQSGRSRGRLEAYGSWWTNSPPTVVDSSADPQGNALTNSRTPSLSVKVTDPDFAYPRDDEVTVDISVDGSSSSSTTITSNTTVSYSASSLSTGSHSWNATASDKWGGSDEGAGWEFRVPGVLTLWNESAPNNKVTTGVTVTFVERDGGASTTITTSDGTVEMNGVPDSELIAVISSDDGSYYDRRLVVPPDENSDGYLLPKSVEAAKIVFELRDNTGQFPAKESALYVERVLTKNGNTKFRTITSDTFGATETVVMVLENKERYSIRVGNDAGDMRELGSYTTAGDARAPLPVGEIQINAGAGTARVAQASLVENSTGSKAIRFVYLDTAESTEELEIRIERADGTVVYPNSTVSGPFGSYALTEPTNFTENRTWFVNYTAYDSNGNAIKGESIPINGLGGTAGGIPWSDRVRRLTGWGLVLMFTGFVVIKQVHMAPAAGTGMATLLTIGGVLQVPLPILGIGGAFAVVALVGGESA